MDAASRYAGWSHEQLVDRIAALELSASKAGLGLPVAKADTNGHASTRDGQTPESEDAQKSALQVGEASGASEQSRKALKRAARKAFREGSSSAASQFASASRPFDVHSQPCRKIALRFSYDGAPYSGLAAQNTDPVQLASSLPTVEGELWKALCEARLVDPADGMEGAGWARCGRTDRGVSAAGQVVSFWIRSRRVDQWELRRQERRVYLDKSGKGHEIETDRIATRPLSSEQAEAGRQDSHEGASNSVPNGTTPPFKPAEDELPYVTTLNRILPPTIRIQAWSPVRPEFSARFDCRYRHYKYFFTSGAPAALQSLHPDAQASAGWNHAGSRLDLDAMRDAASRLLGEHDFRNLCKVDASKQIDNFRRRIDGVSVDVVQSGWRTFNKPRAGSKSIEESEGASIDDESEEMYVLNLRGTAFLYHQVRHIVAVLFMVGARLEPPSIVDELLNVESGALVADRLALRAKRIRAGIDAAEGSDGRIMLPDSTATGFSGQTAADKEREDLLAAHGNSVQSLQQALPQASAKDVQEVNKLYSHLMVIESKPSYEMAADRPLVLWDCGFKAEDVQWRASPYDGELTAEAIEEIAESPERSAASTTTHLHSQWVRSAIQAEINRHFVLAAPSPASGGVLPASVLFQDARFPRLAPAVAERLASEPGRERIITPLGDGTSRSGAPGYTPLNRRKREETVEQKNERWLHGKGKRRAEAKGLTAIQLAKGINAV